MCNPHQTSRPNRLESVIQLLHIISRERDEPIDLYHLHDHFTPSADEFEDHVADANEHVGYHFGYGRPDLGEFEFGRDEEYREVMEGFLEDVWPVDRSLRRGVIEEAGEEVGEDERVCEDEDGVDDEGEAEGEDEQRVSGDVDGDRIHTNTDTTAAEEGEIDTTTSPDTHSAPATSDTPTQQSAANNDAPARND